LPADATVVGIEDDKTAPAPLLALPWPRPKASASPDARQSATAYTDFFPLTSKALPTILTTSADERFRLGLQLMLSGI
jgi:hypothetical protein